MESFSKILEAPKFRYRIAIYEFPFAEDLQVFLVSQGFDAQVITYESSALTFSQKVFDIYFIGYTQGIPGNMGLFKLIRQAKKDSIIFFLADYYDINSHIFLLEQGVDLVWQQPLDFRVFAAQARAFLRRHMPSEYIASGPNFTIGPYHFNYPTRLITIGNKQTRIPPFAAAVLKWLLTYEGQYVSYNMIIADFYGAASGKHDKTFYNTLRQLRDAFNRDPRVIFEGSSKVGGIRVRYEEVLEDLM